MQSRTIAGNVYDKYHTANPVARLLLRRFLARLDSILPPGPARRILEVGCGEGELARTLLGRYRGATFVGCDLSPGIVAEARRRAPGAVFLAADAYALPFPDRSFDLVLLCETLEHLQEPDAALRETARVARGTVVVTVPWEPIWRGLNLARGSYLRDWGNTPGHVQHFGRRAVASLVARHLRVERVAGSLPWTLVRARTRTE